MKRLICFVLIVLCLSGLTVPASARSNTENLSCRVAVGEDGICDVTVTAKVIFEESISEPVFPVPENARNVTLNGEDVEAEAGEHARYVSLQSITGGMPGTYTITVSYRLKNAVKSQGGGKMLLTLPLLSGFAYPVEQLSAEVTLPGEVEAEPHFVSGYYQENTDQLLDVKVSGDTVRIDSRQMLLDHETLTMTLQVDESMFPRLAVTARMLGLLDIAIIVSVVLVLVYYLLTMHSAISLKPRYTTAPVGVMAGQIPVWLMGKTTELTMLVVSWAQMGYLRMEMTSDGRVILHKRMEMGNERSSFEMRCYKNLFGRRRILDGTSDHYARMVRMTAKKGHRVSEIFSKKSGNPWIFRVLCTVPALLSGINLSEPLAAGSVYARMGITLLIAVLALLVQLAARGFALRGKLPVWIASAAAVAWLTLAVMASQWLTALLLVAFELLAGTLATYGGKRTELGQRALEQILGLRRFMRTATKPELLRMLKANPNYYHELAPYALVLGVDRKFAAKFYRLRVPECTYLVSEQGQLTTTEWAAMLRKTVRILNAKAKRPFGGR